MNLLFTCVTEEVFFRGFLLERLAGFGYAMAYLRARRIEGAILTHLLLNAVHFLAFTCPGLGG